MNKLENIINKEWKKENSHKQDKTLQRYEKIINK